MKIFSIVSGLLLFSWFLESVFRGMAPAGTFLCLVQLLYGSFCVWKRWGSPFAKALLLVVLADVGFYYFNYYQQSNIISASGSLISSWMYGFAYWLASIALIKVSEIKLKQDWKRLIMPAVIVLITFLYYFMPTLKHPPEGMSLLLTLVLSFNTVTNTMMAILALTVLIYSINPFMMYTSLGFAVMTLVNYAISSDVYANGNSAFGFYEFFWSFGVFTAETTLLLLMSRSEEKRIVSGNSIGVQYKASMIALVTGLLITVSIFTAGNVIPIKFITLGIVGGMILAILVSSVIVDSVSRYASALGRYLERGFTSSQSMDQSLVEKLPMELEVLFSSVFAQNLENERNRQIRLKKYNDLYQRFGHDIRSPLKAISSLINEVEFKKPDVRNVFVESIQSMNQVSKSILDDIEVEGGAMAGIRKVSMPAIEVTSVISKVTRVFQSSISKPLEMKLNLMNEAYVWIDEGILERVLFNTLNNSAESGSSIIEIGISSNQEELKITISDNGTGTDAKVIENLNRGQKITTKNDGHGIGLSGHWDAIRDSGGSIRFESEKGRGFKTVIQLKKASERIVLIDDDRAIHLAWSTLAKMKKQSMVGVYEKENILERLEKENLKDAEIYVDYRLGNRSGLDVLRMLDEAGYRKLFLATADDLRNENELSQIGDRFIVRDKSFPR